MKEFGKSLGVDPIVAEAFFGSSGHGGPVRAERELMLAVLSDAIECYWKYRKSRAASGIRLYQDAKKWIFAGNDKEPFSFIAICEALQLDPSYIRRGIVTGGESTPLATNEIVAGREADNPRNIKRKLKSGREAKVATRISRPRVRPLRVRPRG